MITEDYVSFETAKLLKKKRFDCSSYNHYRLDNGELCRFNTNCSTNLEQNDYITAPTLQMAMKWLREKHKITIGIVFEGDRIYYEIHQNNEFVFGVDTPKSYEKVCDEAIKYCLENLI